MKFLIIGLGSMGKRRVRNLQYLKAGEIHGFDLRKDRRRETKEKYGIIVFPNIEDALKEKPDAVIISTPPHLHMEYATRAAKQNIHFFTELNMSHEKIDALLRLCKKKNIVAAPSCTMRFHPAIQCMKQLLEKRYIGKIAAFSYHSGQYLPDWHPWEDYHTFFASQKETGACKEIILSELVWITWLFGRINKVSSLKKKSTILEADIEDIYQIILNFEEGPVGNMLVDALARYPVRYCEIIGEKGQIIWDCDKNNVKVFEAQTKNWRTYSQKESIHEAGYASSIIEDMYIEEMKHFIRTIKGEIIYPYTFEEEKRILGIMQMIDKSSEEGKHILIKD